MRSHQAEAFTALGIDACKIIVFSASLTHSTTTSSSEGGVP